MKINNPFLIKECIFKTRFPQNMNILLDIDFMRQLILRIDKQFVKIR